MFIEEKQFVLQEKDLFLVDNMMLKLMKMSETMNEKENWNKEDSVAKVICHAQHSAKKKLLGKIPGSTCKKNPHVIVSTTN